MVLDIFKMAMKWWAWKEWYRTSTLPKVLSYSPSLYIGYVAVINLTTVFIACNIV